MENQFNSILATLALMLLFVSSTYALDPGNKGSTYQKKDYENNPFSSGLYPRILENSTCADLEIFYRNVYLLGKQVLDKKVEISDIEKHIRAKYLRNANRLFNEYREGRFRANDQFDAFGIGNEKIALIESVYLHALLNGCLQLGTGFKCRDYHPNKKTDEADFARIIEVVEGLPINAYQGSDTGRAEELTRVSFFRQYTIPDYQFANMAYEDATQVLEAYCRKSDDWQSDIKMVPGRKEESLGGK